MSEILPLALFTVMLVVGFYIMIVTSPPDDSEDTGDCANLPQNRWRRHPEKPSRLPFRPSRVDRVLGNSRRTQRC